MNSFDYEIITFINQFSTRSWAFDKIVGFLSGNNLIKSGILVALLWWAWFKDKDPATRNRSYVLSTLISCIIAIILGRFLALVLPFRYRPIHDQNLHFLLPHGMNPVDLEGWSSFPSDHAVFFFTLAASLFFISRKVGIFAFIYAAFIHGFTRVYVGLHYPTDIIVGAVIGIGIAVIGNTYFVRTKMIRSAVNWSYQKPQWFYPLFFLLTYQMADMFLCVRAIANGFKELIQKLIG